MRNVVLFLLLLATPVLHAQNLVVSRVVSIYDADTFRVDISGWPPIIGSNMPIRVLGVDAPEIRGKCADEKIKARIAKEVTVNALHNAQIIELRNIKRGKYFRLLADIYLDGKSLASLLISTGHARPYDGGKRAGWCE